MKPKTIFLIDSAGAFLTAFISFCILRTFNEYIGIPQKVLTVLSIIALVFFFYSFICSIFLKDNWRPFLITIMAANLLYCLLIKWIVIHYSDSITKVGAIYFVAEIIVICILVIFEYKTLKSGGQKAEQ